MNRACVVLLHGLGRGRPSMLVPQWRLSRAGYRTLNVGYPSRTQSIESSARVVARRLDRWLPPEAGAVHFLTHSMGGIVVRCMLELFPGRFPPGRIVMLAPPNQGSRMARTLRRGRIFRHATGPAGRQLAAGDSLPFGRPAPPGWSVGVIAGNRSWSPLRSLLPGESDGTVAVDETRLDGMDDFLTVPRGHTFIMNSRRVLTHALRFLERGRFDEQRG
jgi:pimeloyl-ACP methyl ester carboxylesterase